jgi:predicted nucleic acid-binding protein
LADSRDGHHREAIGILRVARELGLRHYTTNVVVVECHALMLSVLGIERAARFVRDIDASNTTVIRARAQNEERAKLILYRYADKEFSFADAISFVVMDRLGIRHAFTFDRHFSQYGFTPLTPARSN